MSDEEKIQIAALGLLGILGRKSKRKPKRSPKRKPKRTSPQRGEEKETDTGFGSEDDDQPKRDALAKKLKENNDTLQRTAAEAKGLLTLLQSRKENAELKGDSKTAGEMGMRIDQLTEAYDGAISNFASTLDEDQLSLAEQSNRILELTIKYMRRLDEETPEERTKRMQRDANDDLRRRKTGQPRKRRGTLELLTGIPQPVETEKKRRGTLELLTGIPQPNKTDNSVSDRAQYLEAFRKYDTDESGSIDLQELWEGYRIAGLDFKSAQEAMGDHDKNGDGKLSFEEFLTWGLGTDALKQWGENFAAAKAAEAKKAEEAKKDVALVPVEPAVAESDPITDRIKRIRGKKKKKAGAAGAKTPAGAAKTKPAGAAGAKTPKKKDGARERLKAEVAAYMKDNGFMVSATKYAPLQQDEIGAWFAAVKRFNKKGEQMALTYLFREFMNAATGRDKGIKETYSQKDLKSIIGEDAFTNYVYDNLTERENKQSGIKQKILPSGDENMASLITSLAVAWQSGVTFKQYVPKAKSKGKPKIRQRKQIKPGVKQDKTRSNPTKGATAVGSEGTAVRDRDAIDEAMDSWFGEGSPPAKPATVPEADPAEGEMDAIDAATGGEGADDGDKTPQQSSTDSDSSSSSPSSSINSSPSSSRGGEEDGTGDDSSSSSSGDEEDYMHLLEGVKAIPLLDKNNEPFPTIKKGFFAVRKQYMDKMKDKLFIVKDKKTKVEKTYRVKKVRTYGTNMPYLSPDTDYEEVTKDGEDSDITGSELLPRLRF